MVKTPFSRSLSRSARPPCEHFSVAQDPFLIKNHTTFPNFLLKMPNFGKFTVPNPKTQSKSSPGSLNSGQNQFWKQQFVQKKIMIIIIIIKIKKKIKISSTGPQIGTDPFNKPPFMTLWVTHTFPNQSWVPLRYEITCCGSKTVVQLALEGVITFHLPVPAAAYFL